MPKSGLLGGALRIDPLAGRRERLQKTSNDSSLIKEVIIAVSETFVDFPLSLCQSLSIDGVCVVGFVRHGNDVFGKRSAR